MIFNDLKKTGAAEKEDDTEDFDGDSDPCCCKCCGKKRCTWRRGIIITSIVVVVLALAAFVYIRVAYKGFFVPKCANPKRGIASLEDFNACVQEIYDMYDMVGLSVALVTTSTSTSNASDTTSSHQWNGNYGAAVLGNATIEAIPITKTFIGVAVMQQVEAGVLDLDEDINSYLTSFQVVNPLVDANANDIITLRSLSTHTAGIIDSDAYDASYVPASEELTMPTLEVFLQSYFIPGGADYNANNNFLNCRAGVDCPYEYSNIGASLAALVVEQAIGISYHQYVEESILQPLQMNNSHFYYDNYTDPFSVIAMPYEEGEDGYYSYPTYPDGHLLTSANDMARYLSHGVMTTGNELLFTNPTRTIPAMLTPEFAVSLPKSEQWVYGDPNEQAIFWTYLRNNAYGHDGGDYGSMTLMYFEPTQQAGIVVLSNYAPLNAFISLLRLTKQVTRHSEQVKNLLLALPESE
ncbi:MAG: hypothetical protein SGILL_005920 [Bacillariaceae sp.]